MRTLFYSAAATARAILAGGTPTAPPNTSLDPGAVAPPGLDVVGSEWISWTTWVGEIGGILGLMACGIMMTIGRKNRSHLAGEGASGIPWVVAGLTIICLSSTIVLKVLQP